MFANWRLIYLDLNFLTHSGQVMYICASKLTIIVLDHGLSPSRRQAYIWTNAVLLLTWLFWINISKIQFETYIIIH